MTNKFAASPRTEFTGVARTKFEAKLILAGAKEEVVEYYERYYQQLCSLEEEYIHEKDIQPVQSLRRLEDLPVYTDLDLLSKVIMIKLNGGLATTMGSPGPKSCETSSQNFHRFATCKSLLRAKGKHSFLDLTIKHSKHLGVPLLLMNSFATREPTIKALHKYKSYNIYELLQNKIPKIDINTLEPIEWERNRELEWCPPGHGDIYLALKVAGKLRLLIESGYKYAFISNIDNLGATIDLSILSYLATSNTPFIMEVTERTLADRKGGHLAIKDDQGKAHQLILREVAQCPHDDTFYFQDIERHKYFNTNNIWINLPQLEEHLLVNKYMDLPLIVNCKRVDVQDSSSPKIYQLETAMGAAISLFSKSEAICVPRDRFIPVKTYDDLSEIRSRKYFVGDDFRLVRK